jgi:hypothetical protein
MRQGWERDSAEIALDRAADLASRPDAGANVIDDARKFIRAIIADQTTQDR